MASMIFNTSRYGGCSVQTAPRICNECLTPEGGRVRAVAGIRTDFKFYDYSNPLEWNLGIYLDKIFIIPKVIGEYNGGEAVTGDGFGDAITRPLGRTHSGTWSEPFDPDNVDFYNGLSGSNGIWRLILVTERYIRDSGVGVSFDPTAPIQTDINSTNLFVVNFSFANPLLIKAYDKPELIFGGCGTLAELVANYCPPPATVLPDEGVCPTDPAELGLYGAYKS